MTEHRGCRNFTVPLPRYLPIVYANTDVKNAMINVDRVFSWSFMKTLGAYIHAVAQIHLINPVQQLPNHKHENAPWRGLNFLSLLLWITIFDNPGPKISLQAQEQNSGHWLYSCPPDTLQQSPVQASGLKTLEF